MDKTKVLVVDDSALMRKVLSDIINSNENFEVIGRGHNGLDAVKMAADLKPDIITLDVEMPEMDGITALKEILKTQKIPIVMVSALTEKGSTKTLEAISEGAVDFILKPQSNSDSSVDDLKEELIRKLLDAVNAKVVVRSTEKRIKHVQDFNPTRKKIVVVGVSTGGPQTLETFLTELPSNIPVPVLVVQHMPPIFTKSLATRLDNVCEIEVREAVEGDTLKDGVAYIAPGNYHMTLTDYNNKLSLHMDQEPKELGVRPNANRLFKSVVPYFKENVIGVILTGMGTDGTEGARAVKEANGTILAQSEETCIIYGMPKSAVEAGVVDGVVDLDKMAVTLLQFLEI